VDCGGSLRLRTFRAAVRAISTIAALAVTALAAASTRAEEVHPWCMVYQDMTGTWSCAFASFEQCRATASGGNGGTCARNPAFADPPKPAAAARRRR